MTTYIVKKTVRYYFEVNVDNWTIKDVEKIAPELDNSDAYHNQTFFSVFEVPEPAPEPNTL